MVDRASKFSNPKLLKLLNEKFIPVAIDQWYQRRQDDSEGIFYRKIAAQGPRSNFDETTQGCYIASAGGDLIAYNNNFGSGRIIAMMKSATSRKHNWAAEPLLEYQPDKQVTQTIPEDVVVIKVNSKVLAGYAKPRSQRHSMMQNAIGRDNLWIRKSELVLLAKGEFPDSLASKIARFHLFDNSRGEPPMWGENDIRSLQVQFVDGKVSGKVELQTQNGSRSFEADFKGQIEFDDESKLTKFDLVFKGLHRGQGKWNSGAPAGEYPLALAFCLASKSDVAWEVLPQAIKAHGRGYVLIGK